MQSDNYASKYTCPTQQAECGWGLEVDSVCGGHRRIPTIGSQVKFDIDGFYFGKEHHDGRGRHELCYATILEGLGRHNFLEMEAAIINRDYNPDGGCPKWAKYYRLSTEYKSKHYFVFCLFVSHNQIAILNTNLPMAPNKPSTDQVVPTSIHYITRYTLTSIAKWDDAGTEVVRRPIRYTEKGKKKSVKSQRRPRCFVMQTDVIHRFFNTGPCEQHHITRVKKKGIKSQRRPRCFVMQTDVINMFYD